MIAVCYSPPILLAQPENLLYASEDGDADLKIVDFGMATYMGDDGTAVMESICGTPSYLGTKTIGQGRLSFFDGAPGSIGCSV